MSRPLVLVAAGGLAAEVVEAVRAGATYEPIGVLDDDDNRRGDDVCGVPVLGGLDRLDALEREHPDLVVIVCSGRGASRERLVVRLSQRDGGAPEFGTVVHPGASIPASATIGAGTILLAGVVLTARVTVHEHVVVMPGAVLTHDDVLHDFVTVCAGVVLGGGVDIGRRAYLGMASSVREGLHVGADAVVGMGAAAVRDVRSRTTVIGVPARPLPAGAAHALLSGGPAVLA